MQKKKSFAINPKEYEADGLFHEDDSFGQNSRPQDWRRGSGGFSKGDELTQLRTKINKLEAYKRKVESYESYYLVDPTKIEHVRVSSEYGCKEAYVLLKRDLEDSRLSCTQGTYADYSEMDTKNLQGSKSYLVFSPTLYYEMGPLLEDMRRCRLERLGVQRSSRNTIGCLLLDNGEYVFFWPKVLLDQDADCSVDSTTDTQSEGL